MIKRIIICFLLVSLTLQGCDSGCMKCDTSSQCIVCDQANMFYLSNGSCVKSYALNCVQIAQDGSCVQCSTGYYLDLNTKTCATLGQLEVIPNCKYYNSSKACVQCLQNFYISGANCIAAIVNFANCDFLTGDNACSRCISGFIFNNQRTACIPKPSTSNCGGFSSIQCQQCSDGYFLNQNLYLKGFSNINAINLSTLNSIIQFLTSGNISEWTTSPVCQALADVNCKVASSLSTCSQCNTGYFPNAFGKCEALLATLPNCSLKYPDNNNCIECQGGYFLNSNFKCSIRAITTCLTYNVSADSCLTCDITRYLNNQSYCQTRFTRTCLTYSLTSDTCLTCQNNIRFLNANSICQDRLILNCGAFRPLSDTCSSCIVNTHWYDGDYCITRTISNCLNFNPVANNCLTCNIESDFRTGNVCTARTANRNCQTYTELLDTCATCARNREWFNNGVCVARIHLACLVFTLNANTCDSCTITTHFFSNSLCNSRTVTTCLTYNYTTDTCATCTLETHWMNGSSVCVARTAGQYCVTYNPTQDVCTSCDYTYRYLNSGACLARTRPYCTTVSNTENSCTACIPGFYLSAGVCALNTAANCATIKTDSNLCDTCIVTAYKDGADNLCKLYTVANCATWSSTANACLTCLADFYLSAGNCLANTKPNCSNLSQSSLTCNSCINNAFTNGSGDCQVYTVANCLTFNTALDACVDCKPDFYLNAGNCVWNTSTNCASKSLIANACLVCNSGYYLNSGSCSLIGPILNCKTHDTALNICLVCNDYYYLSGGGASCLANVDLTQNIRCVEWSGANVCTKCSDWYLLTSPTTCTAITESQKLPNCVLYRSDVSTIQCAQCITGQYVYLNECIPRVKSASIPNCSVFSPMADRCQTCSGSRRPTDDGLKCLNSITDCIEYKATTVNSLNHFCLKCSVGKYATSNGDNCPEGLLSRNCQDYNTDGFCNSCKEGYWLNGRNCVAHDLVSVTTITDCSARSTTKMNECETCSNGWHPFRIYNGCDRVPGTTDCSAYTDLGVCEACRTGFYLTSTNTCTTLPSNCSTANGSGHCLTCISDFYVNNNACVALPPNCLAVTTPPNCSACKAGFLLDSTPCFGVFNYISAQCDTTNDSQAFTAGTALSSVCKQCKSGAIRQNIGGASMCIENSLRTKFTITTVANCKRYGSVSPFLCFECESTYHLDDIETPGNCVTNTEKCSTATTPGMLVLDNLNGRLFGCKTTTIIAGCEVAARYDLSGTTADAYACLQVFAPFSPVVALDPVYINMHHSYDATSNYNAFQSKIFPDGKFYHGFKITPTNISTSLVDYSPNGTFEDCLLYFLGPFNKHFCYKANLVGHCIYANSNILDPGVNMVSTTFLISNCDTTSGITGFPAHLQQILGCPRCTAVNAIPTLYILISGNAWGGPTNMQNSEACETKSLLVDANCSVQANVFTDFHQTGGSTMKCVSCAPGYKPTYAADKTVTSCAAITDCDLTEATNKIANKCQKCYTRVGNSLSGQFVAWATPEKDACIATNTDNCMFASGTGGNCGICKPGYHFNRIGQCEQLVLPGCNDASSTLYPTITTTNTLEYLHMAALAQASMFGCNSCASASPGPYTLMPIPAGEIQCIQSAFVAANDFSSPSASMFVPNCDKYDNSEPSGTPVKFICRACKTGFIFTTGNLQCVTTISNCNFANPTTTTLCADCANPWVNVNGACVARSIPNCATYTDTTNTTPINCATCNDGHSKYNGGESCNVGTILNCKTYADNNTVGCLTCNDNYALYITAAGVRVCTEIKTKTNCIRAVTSAMNLSRFVCTKCFYDSTYADAYVLKNIEAYTAFLTMPRSVCLTHPTIDGCSSHSHSSSEMAANTFACAGCTNTAQFLRASDSTCQTRTPVLNCPTYTSGVDTCAVCSPGHYISPDKLTCTPFPNIVANCRTYSSSSICAVCEPPYYLSTNACVRVTSIVKDCLTYSSATACSVCQPGYFLTSNTECTWITAQNCLTYETASRCATCTAPLFLQLTDASPRNCNYWDMSYCATTTDSAWPPCATCKPNTFVDPVTGYCTPPPVAIPFCVTYDSFTTCVTCQTGRFPTAISRLSCDLPTVTNCTTPSSLVTCSTCNANYFLNLLNTCTRPSIENCSTHNSWNTCQTCNAGNYFKTNSDTVCTLASAVSNCQTYLNLTDCSACISPYLLENNTCVLQQPIVDCEIYSNSTTCLKCFAGKWPVLQRCDVPTTVPGCSFYDSRTTCQTCQAGYFKTSDTVCSLIVTVPNCATYSSATICDTCKAGYEKVGNTCHLILNIVSCLTMSAYNVCSSCRFGSLLVSNACPDIVTIPNCNSYSGLNTCNGCDTGYWLVGNACLQQMSIPNCLTWIAYNLCSSCSAGSRLTNGACPLIVAIDGCITWSAFDTCSECANGRYLYQNKCSFGEITNCLVHSGLFICSVCKPTFVRSTDGQFCLPSFTTFNDPNCKNSRLLSDPACTVCSPGFYFDALGVCTSCSTNLSNTGCLICNPENSNACFMCQQGYYQDANGGCTAFSLSSFNTNPNTDPNNSLSPGSNSTNSTTNNSTNTSTNGTGNNTTNGTGNTTTNGTGNNTTNGTGNTTSNGTGNATNNTNSSDQNNFTVKHVGRLTSILGLVLFALLNLLA